MHLTCRAVLFDLDGVLIDSIAAVSRVWHAWALEHGLDPEHVISTAHGRRSIESIRLLAPNVDAESENNEIERREIEDLEGVVLIPGARELLNSLPPDRWTVVTSGTRPLATARLRHAGLPVPPEMITANEVANGKPHPEPYLKGAEILGVSPADCLVVEDAPSGLRSAKAAGMRSFGIPHTYPVEELSDATILLQSLADLTATSDGDLITFQW